MDHRYVEEHNLIERYVLGRLPLDEQIRFEEHFADCPECVAELETAGDLATALRAAAAEDARAVAGAGLAAAVARRLAGPRAAVLLGLLVAAVALPSLWLVAENRRLAGELASLRRPQVNVPSLLLTLARDTAAAPVPELSVSAGQPWLTLAIEADSDIASFDALLRDATGRPVWQAEGLEPDLWGVLRLTFPAALLPPGDYRLELAGRDDAGRSEPMGAYPFRVSTP